ncbi:hypothetical protein DSO57_1016382 [Entomophthora muscae]|uniref:Uncharacterized protein n=1 Tax=Entomophthora muscae TaxID=34485 RepID=A0ACC2RJG3_9FUNG|nr:hypothetical protein DSO57_1016382 [Entomophthora muscae]
MAERHDLLGTSTLFNHLHFIKRTKFQIEHDLILNVLIQNSSISTSPRFDMNPAARMQRSLPSTELLFMSHEEVKLMANNDC